MTGKEFKEYINKNVDDDDNVCGFIINIFLKSNILEFGTKKLVKTKNSGPFILYSVSRISILQLVLDAIKNEQNED